jgi:iron complex outermembrane receptor protein
MTERWLASKASHLYEEVGARGLFMCFFILTRPVPAATLAIVSSTVFAQVAPLPSVVVTASRFATPLADAPIGMTVIDRDQIAASTASNLAELLGQQVSVQVRDNAGSPDRQIDLRGFGITGDQNTLILLDGRRLNENELASTRLSAIPLASIERIEILRGSGSVLYGGGATGGTIQIITRASANTTAKAPSETPQSSVGLVAGSLDTRELRASTGTSHDRVRFQIDASALDTANWRDNNALRQHNAGGELRTLFERGFLALRLGAESQQLGLPGARSLDQFKSDPRGTSTPKDHAQREDYRLALAGAWRTSSLEFEAELAHREGRVASDYRQFDYYSMRDRRTLSFTPRLRSTWSAGGIQHETVFGLDTESWRYVTRGASSAEMLDSPFVQTSASQQSQGLYVQHRAALAQGLSLTAGLRRQRIADEITDQVTPSLSVQDAHWVTASNIGVRQTLAAGFDVYARGGRSFRIATVDELTYFFPSDPQQLPTARLLVPQTSTDREVGLQWRKTGAALRLSLFRNDLNHEIHYYAPAFSNVNLPPTQRAGLELEGTFQPTPQLDLSAGFTRLEARFRGGEVGGVPVSGREIPLVPRLSLKVAAVWSPLEGTRLSLAARHTGRQRFDNDQANEFQAMPSYTLVDIKASQRLGRWLAALKVGNLLDRRYFDYGILGGFPASPSVYPQSGRTVMFSLERGF